MVRQQVISGLRRDPAHIKDDMRRSAARLWGLSDLELERLDPLVDLLLGAFAQEIFSLQQQVADHKRRTVEAAVQALLPADVAAPRPAQAIMHGRPVDPGTWTHRTRTVFSTTHGMDVHDRTGTTFHFTPVAEFRLYNGGVGYLASGDQLVVIDGLTGQRRVIPSAIPVAVPRNELWIGVELDEPLDPVIGLPLFFSLPTGDPATQLLQALLPHFRFDQAGRPWNAAPGLEPRRPEDLDLAALLDPVRVLEREALAIRRHQFVTLRPTGRGTHFPDRTARPPWTQHFGEEAAMVDEGRVQWLRAIVPGAMDPQVLARLHCSMNCFPVLNRVLHERSTSGSRLLALTHADDLQFWAVDQVVMSDGTPARHERTAGAMAGSATYAVRRGGMERMDAREAYERLHDLLDTVRSDHAAFTALGETDLARGLRHIAEWLGEYKARQVRPGYPSAYVLINTSEKQDAHVHYWATNGDLAERLPAMKNFRLNSGAYLTACRLVTVPEGGSDVPERIGDRLHGVPGAGGHILPTAFTVKSICHNALPASLRGSISVTVTREIAIGTEPGTGLQRVLTVVVSGPSDLLSESQWKAQCDHLSAILNATFMHLLPVRVAHRILA